MGDTFYTIRKRGEAQIREKMSRFIAFAIPISEVDEAKRVVKDFQNEYHDARHVCWAYMIGPTRTEWQLNDNGEPSGTAGKPILGQINSRGLTDVLVVVVRYFGGIKLGTPGLIAAYKEAASIALDDAGIKEMHSMKCVKVTFPYVAADGVMKILKNSDIEIVSREFDNTCSTIFLCREDFSDELIGRLSNLDGTSLEIVENG